ncbi:hypothetical protein [Niallia sp. MER 6]|uniref:hypothetical protein n=1 Tax=Niallia sp. MER 6 TaxID=2939567 RepID=UPI00203BADC8|nr:hypothetical protein [Niallia sp. MER 6]MCM3033299.1 hypothetical protein [Niallia sp. MER 6]
MNIHKPKLKILSIDHEFQNDHEDSANQCHNLWIKVSVINNKFLEYILLKPKFNGGDFSVKLKEREKNIKLKMYPYNSQFEKMIYTTRTFNELLEGTVITFKSVYHTKLFLEQTETVLTKYLTRSYVQFQKNKIPNTTIGEQDKLGLIDDIVEQSLLHRIR